MNQNSQPPVTPDGKKKAARAKEKAQMDWDEVATARQTLIEWLRAKNQGKLDGKNKK